MAQSFKTDSSGPLADVESAKQRLLVTGAAGNIGYYFALHAHKKYDLRLMVRPKEEYPEDLGQYGEVVAVELADLKAVEEACQGMETVLHLAGNPSPVATWSDLLESNIVGTYHTLVSAKHACCKRVVLASSIHAVSGYPLDVQVKTSDPVNPGDLYGVTKCFGEALGRYMATQEGLSVLAIRIGAFQPLSSVQNLGGMPIVDSFVSPRDLQQLLEKAIDVKNLQFGIFHGLSDNHFKRLDITDSRELLGYAPRDNSVHELPQLRQVEFPPEGAGKDPEETSGIRDELKQLN